MSEPTPIPTADSASVPPPGGAFAALFDPRAARARAEAPLDVLLDKPHGFAFFQAARLLERAFDGVPASDGRSAFDAVVRFRNSVSLAFAPSEIEALGVGARTPDSHDAGDDDGDTPTASQRLRGVERIDITLPFFGLLGNNGALPNHYTEQVARREIYQKDFAARAFLDIFAHRAALLFYKAWRKHRLPVQFEQDRQRHYLPLVLAVAGFGLPGSDRTHSARHRVRDESLAYFAGALQQRPVSAGQIERIVAHHFGVACRIEQFVGHWFDLPDAACTRLGQTQAVLGASALSGARVWQRDLRIRLLLGPLTRARFRALLPRGEAAQALGELVRLTVGPTIEVEVRLVLQRDAVGGTSLGGAAGEGAAQLGWDSWLHTGPAANDRDDVVYELHQAA